LNGTYKGAMLKGVKICIQVTGTAWNRRPRWDSAACSFCRLQRAYST